MSANTQQWQVDSDMIFTQVSTGDFEDYDQAEQLIVMLYVPDMTITRAGISHAMVRLQGFYAGRAVPDVLMLDGAP